MDRTDLSAFLDLLDRIVRIALIAAIALIVLIDPMVLIGLFVRLGPAPPMPEPFVDRQPFIPMVPVLSVRCWT